MAKPEFYSDLSATAIPPNRWRLDKPLRYLTLVTGKPEDIVAESGFDTDLASIPRLVRPILPGNGKERRAAVMHDKVYRSGGLFVLKSGGSLTRKQCDQMMLEGMLVDGVLKHRAYLIYWGVRSGGWVTFNKNRRRYMAIHGFR